MPSVQRDVIFRLYSGYFRILPFSTSGTMSHADRRVTSPPPYIEARCTDSYVFILDNRPTTHGDALVVNTAELAFPDSIKLQIPVLV